MHAGGEEVCCCIVEDYNSESRLAFDWYNRHLYNYSCILSSLPTDSQERYTRRKGRIREFFRGDGLCEKNSKKGTEKEIYPSSLQGNKR